MNALERDVIERFRLLDEEAQKRVRAVINHEMDDEREGISTFDFDAWWREIESIRIDLKANRTASVPTVQDLLDEVREERDADILRSIRFGNHLL